MIVLFVWMLSLIPAIPNLWVWHVVPLKERPGAVGCDPNTDLVPYGEAGWRFYTLIMVLMQVR